MARTFGRYRLMRHLATGGMGDVWLAEAAGAAGFVKRLVIKTLRPELAADERLIEQFVAEGRLLEALDHPNIAQILDLGCIDGEWFLAMEWVQGFDLRALRRALPSEDGVCKLGGSATIAIVAAAASALDHAATRQDERGQRLHIVHHDVTPSNLMVRRDGLVKLVDFGVARSALLTHVDVGALRGKIPYLAPEQLQGGLADARTDLFALGLCAFEFLTGERALQAVDVDGLPAAWQALPTRLASLDDVGCDPGLVALVRSLCALDMRDRPDHAGRVAATAAELSVQLGIGRPELVLARELAPAFVRLEAQEGGFDATLAGMVAVDRLAAGEGTGTVSLPGLSTPSPVAAGGAARLFVTPTPLAPLVVDAADDGVRSNAALLSPADVVSTAPEVAADAPRGTKPPRRAPIAITLLSVALALAIAALVLRPAVDANGAAAEDGLGESGTDATIALGAPADGGASAETDAASASAQAAVRDDVAAGPAADATVEAAPLPSTATDARPAEPIAIDAPPAAAGVPAAGTADGDPSEQAADGEPRGARAAAPGRAEPRAENSESSAEPRARRETGTAVIRFRVVPADAEVLLDGKLVAGGAGSTGVHELRVAAGSHRIEVRDPTSAAVERRTLSLRAGDDRNLPGFVLVGGLP